MKEEKYPDKMVDKLKISFESFKIEYEHANMRFRDWDNKLNMLFVFFASEVAALILTLTSGIVVNSAVKVFTIISIFLLLGALISIAQVLPVKLKTAPVEPAPVKRREFTPYKTWKEFGAKHNKKDKD